MGLFRPEWMNPNESVADSAVRKLTKEAELIRAALQSPHKRVRQYAIDRISDQEVLARIAAEDKRSIVPAGFGIESQNWTVASSVYIQTAPANAAWTNTLIFPRLYSAFRRAKIA